MIKLNVAMLALLLTYGSSAMADIGFPETILNFQRGETIDNEVEHSGMGRTIPYTTQSVKATIYVYDLNIESIPDGPKSEILLEHFRDEVAQVHTLVEYGVYESAIVNDTYGTGSPERGAEFLCADISITQKGRELNSYLYLTGSSGKFVKIRVTSIPTGESELRAREFADAVAELLWSKK